MVEESLQGDNLYQRLQLYNWLPVWQGLKQESESYTVPLTAAEAVSSKSPPTTREWLKAWLKDHNQLDDKTSWHEFSQNTTFHGVRYIFDGTRKYSTIRRCLWILTVVVAIMLFVIQVGLRSIVYFQYHTNLDVHVEFKNKVEFPTVTICNQNSYKLTEAARLKVYDVLDGIHSARLNENSSLPDVVNNVNLTSFTLQLAHKRRDFIMTCKWRGTDCNISEDFNTVITDFGVCEMFTLDNRPETRYTEQAGAQYGLKMMLNIEQYEYMNGPNTDAGIKMLLHEPTDYPLVKDLGFLISPGTHALVGVRRTESHDLEPPYGNCNLSQSMSRSHCVVQCRNRAVVETCDCRDIYMPNTTAGLTGFDICTFKEKYFCIDNQLDTIKQSQETCSYCKNRCFQVHYEATLSNAQLSQYNIERLNSMNLDEKMRMRGKFLGAREVSQRMFSRIRNDDTSIVNKIVSELQKRPKISRMHRLFADSTLLANTLDDVDLLAYNSTYSTQDTWAVRSLALRMSQTLEFTTKMLRDRMSYQYKLLLCSGCPETLLEVFSGCAKSKANSSETYVPRGYKSCQDYMKNRVYRQKFAGTIYDDFLVPSLQNIDEDYKKHLAAVIQLGPAAIWNNTAHRECQSIIQDTSANSTKVSLTRLGKVLEAHAKVILDVNSSLVAKLMSVKYINVTVYGRPFYEALKPCHWILNYLEACYRSMYEKHFLTSYSRLDYDRTTRMTEAHKNIKDSYSNLRAEYVTKVVLLQYIDKLYGQALVYFRKPLQDYITRTKRKSDLVRVFNAFEAKNILDRMLAYKNSILKFDKYSTYRQLLLKDVSTLVGSVGEYNLHFMRHDNLEKFGITTLMKNSKNKVLRTLYKRVLSEGPREVMPAVVTAFNRSLSADVLTKLLSPIRDNMNFLTRELQQFQASLEAYESNNNMDKQFYMANLIQVDVFYKELQYESKRQQPAFEFISLLSEVGGFLGLLLGASVLTMCELVDHLAVCFLHWLRKKKQVSPMYKHP